jgi:hypothetical protein
MYLSRAAGLACLAIKESFCSFRDFRLLPFVASVDGSTTAATAAPTLVFTIGAVVTPQALHFNFFFHLTSHSWPDRSLCHLAVHIFLYFSDFVLDRNYRS